MNFYREPIQKVLKLDTIEQINQKHLIYLSKVLTTEINLCSQNIFDKQELFSNFKYLVKESCNNINNTSSEEILKFNCVPYLYPNIKKSMLSFVMNKIGIAGYHNPFTGEAIINTNIPDFLKPAAIVHEITHQLGFAREYDAAFISYLLAKHNERNIISYSIYLDIFLLINNILMKSAPQEANFLIEKLNPMPKKHSHHYYSYIRKNRSSLGSKLLTDYTYNFFINLNDKTENQDKKLFILLLLSYLSKIDKTQFLESTQ